MILFRKKADLSIRRDDLKKNKFKIGLVPQWARCMKAICH